MISLAQHDLCTGCGACSFVCPKQCITMQCNDIGVDYPIIDESLCIECHRCQKVCPVLTPIKLNAPSKAFAAWSNNDIERKTSASGGIATELYKLALSQGYKIVGAVQQSDFSVKLELTDSANKIPLFKNSKYVKSTCNDVYSDIKKTLELDCKVLCICLPCQIGAFKSVFRNNKNLVLVDIVCHGGTPDAYLKQHIKHIENQTGTKCKTMSFRDPNFETYKYYFTLYDNNGMCFYSKRTADGDLYQFGFHRSVTYRKNCFNCIFAKTERASDITLLDFKGLNDMSPKRFSNINVSGVLVNSEIGLNLLEKLYQEKNVSLIERPTVETIQTDPRLREHSKDNDFSLLFRELITQSPNDFEGVMEKVMIAYKKANRFSIVKRIIRRIKLLLRK